jgi:hypothetical protein
MSDEKPRASGRTANEEVTREEGMLVDQQMEIELPDERERKFQTTGFSRLKLDFSDDARTVLTLMKKTVERQITRDFRDAYDLMFELFSVVREPVLVDGEPVIDQHGLVEWRTNESGQFIEDWTKLNGKQRERFLFQLTTRLVTWEQLAEDYWVDSMFAKVTWEQVFSEGYDTLLQGSKDTIEGRTARGKILAKEDHYLAIFKTFCSRKATDLVRSMERLSQRLKDVHLANGGR